MNGALNKAGYLHSLQWYHSAPLFELSFEKETDLGQSLSCVVMHSTEISSSTS